MTHQPSKQSELISGEPVNKGKPKFLIAGTGAIVKKLAPTWQMFSDLGVELHAADIRDDASGRDALPQGTHFYNWIDQKQLKQLVQTGWNHPFDYVYLSTFPSVHIATALRLDFIAKNFIFPKPVDSHFSIMETIYSEHVHDRAFRDMTTRSCVHDHYRNKPVTALLKGQMQDLHGNNGFLKNVTVFITEHRTIQAESKRRESLECGMILDLGPHALSVISELVPNTLTWRDIEGHTYKRISRRFEIVSAIRARDNGSILHNLEAETFAALHLRVFEDIDFIPEETNEVTDRIVDRPFDLLIVVGKGVSIQDRQDRRDLKAIELEFDGQFVRGNFDTNAVSGVINQDLDATLRSKIDLRHRGLNLPLQDLGSQGFSLKNLENGHLVTPFQSFGEAFSIAYLLEHCRIHHTARDLVRYAPLDRISDVVNRCVAKGLDPKWARDDDLSGLVFGEVPMDKID